MKKGILVFAIAAAISQPAHAEQEGKTCYPPVDVQAEAVAKEIIDQYIEANGWCGKAVPEPKPGQIVIYYERDAQGKCVAKVKSAKSE